MPITALLCWTTLNDISLLVGFNCPETLTRAARTTRAHALYTDAHQVGATACLPHMLRGLDWDSLRKHAHCLRL